MTCYFDIKGGLPRVFANISFAHLHCKILQALYIACYQMGAKLFFEQLLFNDTHIQEFEKVIRDQSSSICWWQQRRFGEVHKNACFE